MPLISFEQLKQLLKDAVQDPNFIATNTILQDGVTQTNLFDHVEAIRAATFADLTEQHVTTGNTSGLVTLNRLDRHDRAALIEQIAGSTRCQTRSSTRSPIALTACPCSSRN